MLLQESGPLVAFAAISAWTLVLDFCLQPSGHRTPQTVALHQDSQSVELFCADKWVISLEQNIRCTRCTGCLSRMTRKSETKAFNCSERLFYGILLQKHRVLIASFTDEVSGQNAWQMLALTLWRQQKLLAGGVGGLHPEIVCQFRVWRQGTKFEFVGSQKKRFHLKPTYVWSIHPTICVPGVAGALPSAWRNALAIVLHAFPTGRCLLFGLHKELMVKAENAQTVNKTILGTRNGGVLLCFASATLTSL